MIPLLFLHGINTNEMYFVDEPASMVRHTNLCAVTPGFDTAIELARAPSHCR